MQKDTQKEQNKAQKETRNRNNRNRNNNRDNRDVKDQKNPKVIQSKMYEALKYDASNIYFNNLIGTNLSTTSGTVVNFLPGILVFDSVPNFSSRSDMINVAATSIYTYVRHANSGRTNYESSDLMLYLIAISEIFVGITELTRVYGLANYFTSRNLYSGHLVKALGFDPKILRNNLADVRYAINVLINKTKAFAVPRVFNYFDERIAEHLNVFFDEPTKEAQLIAVRPGVLGSFNATGNTKGGSIDFADNTGEDRDIYKQIEKVSNMIDILRDNEDMNIISGDILKAYSNDLFTLSPIEVDFYNEPIYDELSLIQFQNGHYLPLVKTSSLTQSGNKLNAYLSFNNIGNYPVLVGDRLLNSPLVETDPNLIFAISKYQVVVSDEIENRIVSANTTVLTEPRIYHFDGEGAIEEFDTVNVNQFLPMSASGTITLIILSKFKYHPYIYIQGYGLPFGDMHYVARLSKEDTNRMNDARFILSFQTLQMG